MINKTLKWSAFAISVVGLVGVVLVLQEFWPVDSTGLSIEHVRQKELVADFIYPSSNNALPVIVFLGGSGGGLKYEEELKALALNGYAVLSLAFFKEAGLPDKLENIPLEYFEHAFEWLKTKRQLDTNRLFLMGVSRGAELALLLGSTYPLVKGVIAYAPGCFVLPNATEIDEDTLVASWTLNSRPVPFAHIQRFEENSDASIDYIKYIDPLLKGRNDEEEYVIKVERINGPILLISGAHDLVWPSAAMANRIEERLKQRGFQHEVNNIIFENGGHDLLMFKRCYPVVSSIAFRKFSLTIRGRKYEFNLGGTAAGVIHSKVKSRELTLQFIDKYRGGLN
ncbi:acyl-CoA thioester hydrolase/BAAT C-terminal domain-containing protein [Chryseolinea sp. T2]|uniref:acyl-CoA thioester hydrolase/BAAT C-terminal domain-containing protein n=1 Tax=Chryseolinea sp. T2 TaxID=3129255 RepID=UPI003077DA29